MNHCFLPRSRRALVFLVLPFVVAGLALSGCGRFGHRIGKQYVYVCAEHVFLRDRLAAVALRTAEVKNGDTLEVVDHYRHFYKVKTKSGAVGWLDDRAVIDQADYDKFMALDAKYAHAPVVATAVLDNNSNLHLAPGRKVEHFHVLDANTQVALLMRASLPKPMPAQAVPVPLSAPARKAPVVRKPTKRDPNAPPYVPQGPRMEDWWLVRGPHGETGWVLSRMLSINIPQVLDGLVGSEQYIAAYQLGTMYDPESKFPNGEVPEYVAITNTWRAGLPYDFDQVHVFTWDKRGHHYELAFRERGIEGYLPVTLGTTVFNGKTEPTFTIRVNTGDPAVTFNPTTGLPQPSQITTQTYRLEGDLIYPVEPPGTKTAKPRR